MKIDILALKEAWNHETAAGAQSAEHGTGNPRGQCAVTALLIQDLCGGDLVRAVVDNCGAEESHYWNSIPGMGEIDLTGYQYGETVEIPKGEVVPRSRLLKGDRALAARTPERYERLKDRYWMRAGATGLDPAAN